MTVYATEADFKAAFSTAKFEQITAEFTDGFVAQISRSSRFIDGQIKGRYVVPLSLPCDENITHICLRHARWFLYDDSKFKSVEDEYRDALLMLDDIINGKLSVSGATPADIVVTPKAAAIATGSPQVFTSDYLDKLL
jgi:phage gp36-like protein